MPKGKGKGAWMVVGVIALVVIAIFAVSSLFGVTPQTGSVITEGGAKNVGEVGCEDVQCQVIPTYSYSAQDAFSTTSVGGTDRIKSNGNNPVTSLANPEKCSPIEYWKENETYYCDVVVEDAAKCGGQSVEAACYKNASSVTLKVRDMDNDATLTDSAAGATNVTINANGLANLEYRYQGVSKESLMPFGGCVVVETPSTITSVSMDGEGISSAKACPYVLTYTVASTSNTYRAFEVPSSWDVGTVADLKRVAMQLQAGASNPAGVAYVTLYPANYYITNDGTFKLGIEKDANQDTTKVGYAAAQTIFGIA